MRTNKTKNNLELVWKQLDVASENLYNALDALARMTNLPDDVERQSDMIDISRVDILKNNIEELIQKKVNEKQ